MYVLIAIVFAALFAALFLRQMSRNRAKVLANLDTLPSLTQPVDVQALRNLLDAEQTEYLRSRLPFWQFCRVHRERTLAAAEYVDRIAKNAGILLQLGQLGRTNEDSEVARAAQDIVERALLVRMIAMQSLFKLYVQSVIPGVDLSTREVFERYLRLTESTLLFTRLQRPAYAGRISAVL
jgi:hypothetical protein